MWYISFHGGPKGINNILIYPDSGHQHSQSELLPTDKRYPLRELRGFVVVDKLLYIVNGYKKYSQILIYQADEKGDYHFKEILTPQPQKDIVNPILHPYDLTFDTQGQCYISSQDTNVITGLSGDGRLLQVASYLQQQYPSPKSFLAGTIVASSIGILPDSLSSPIPPNVSIPQGLNVSFIKSTSPRVAHSVRGVLFHNGYLYVADEPANAVKVYDVNTGELYSQIKGDNLSAPVQLLLQPTSSVLYISSSGNDSVVSCDLLKGPSLGNITPTTFIDGQVKHISGMAFDENGDFYAAERIARKIKKFPPDGSGSGKKFITDLPDEPEFILYVPKNNN